MSVTLPKATNGYQYDQFCARLKLVIDGTAHGIQAIWDNKFTT